MYTQIEAQNSVTPSAMPSHLPIDLETLVVDLEPRVVDIEPGVAIAQPLQAVCIATRYTRCSFSRSLWDIGSGNLRGITVDELGNH